MLTPLEKHYNKHKEDERLRHRHGIVEFNVSMKYIHDYLSQFPNKSKVRILDVGAGTGIYTIALKNEGYDVMAVELVQHNIDVMLKKDPSVSVRKGDARDLSFIGDGIYDLTIFFGPLYHLMGDEENLKAIREARRVTKPGGVIMVAYLMNDYSILSYCFAENRMAELRNQGFVDETFHVRSDNDSLYDYVRMDDIERLNREAGLKRLKIFSPEGAADFMRLQLNHMDDVTFKMFIDYQMQRAEAPEVIGAGSHVVDIVIPI